MNRAHIHSSIIEQVGYDLEQEILELKFKEDRFAVRQYLHLPMRVFRAFMRASSKTNYFLTRIKGNYAEKKVMQ